MRWIGRGALLGILATGAAGAQTIPRLGIEVTLGRGGHTYSTPKDSFTSEEASMNRLAAAFRVGPERALTPVLLIESSIGNGGDQFKGTGSCPFARCAKAYPGPSGVGLGLEGRGAWSRFTLGTGGGIGMYPRFTRSVVANGAVRVISNWSVLVDIRHIWSTSENNERIIFHPLSFGIRYLHNGEE